MDTATGSAGGTALLIPGTEPLDQPDPTTGDEDQADEPECRFCHRPVRSAKSLRWRIGGRCRRKLRAKQRAMLGAGRRPRSGSVIEQDPLPGF